MAIFRAVTFLLLFASVLCARHSAVAQSPAQAPRPLVEFKPIPSRTYPRPVESWPETQIALARRGFSSGPIDGVVGTQTTAALRAFQKANNLRPHGRLDEATRDALKLETPPLTQITLTESAITTLQPLEKTWLGKSKQTALAHETALELIAERTHTSPRFIEALNPKIDWLNPTALAGAHFTVPDIILKPFPAKAARINISLTEHILQVHDSEGNLLAHFPISIARDVEKRPVGELHVTVAIADPDYTFNPATFPESAEARELGRKLILPPGPNNPVGIAWIGLDRPSYGLHGTPSPEQVGRTESHGCFRLANWDVRTLLDLVWVGLPVTVSP